MDSSAGTLEMGIILYKCLKKEEEEEERRRRRRRRR